MANAESQAKLRALAQYFRNGGAQPTPEQMKQFRSGTNDPNWHGEMSAADPAGKPQVQNVPAIGMHDASAPEGGLALGTMDEMAAQRQKQVDLANMNSQAMQHEWDEPDRSGYTTVPNRFQNLKQQIQPQDEDDEDNN